MISISGNDAPKAHNVKLLDTILGFRLVGQAKLNGDGSIGGARTELLTQDTAGNWRIRAVQPASGRELLMYTLLLEAWEVNGRVISQGEAMAIQQNSLFGLGAESPANGNGILNPAAKVDPNAQASKVLPV